MSSSLNEFEFKKLRIILTTSPSISDLVGEEFFTVVDWNTKLVEDFWNKLLELGPSEENIKNLYTWALVNFAEMKRLNEGSVVQSQYDLSGAIQFIFKYVSRPTKIPFKYWSDITPDLFSEIRRFQTSGKRWIDFWKSDLNVDSTAAKDAWLKSNPETSGMFEKWERENLYG